MDDGKDDDVCIGWWPLGLTVTEGPFLLDALMHTFAPWHCYTATLGTATVVYFISWNNAADDVQNTLHCSGTLC